MTVGFLSCPNDGSEVVIDVPEFEAQTFSFPPPETDGFPMWLFFKVYVKAISEKKRCKNIIGHYICHVFVYSIKNACTQLTKFSLYIFVYISSSTCTWTFKGEEGSGIIIHVFNMTFEGSDSLSVDNDAGIFLKSILREREGERVYSTITISYVFCNTIWVSQKSFVALMWIFKKFQ